MEGKGGVVHPIIEVEVALSADLLKEIAIETVLIRSIIKTNTGPDHDLRSAMLVNQSVSSLDRDLGLRNGLVR